jgi:hypothetical protein
VDYVRVKVISDSLYDEAGLYFSGEDSINAGIGKNFFQGDNCPYVFFKSAEQNPLCVTTVAQNSTKKVVPLYIKHNTGGLFTMSFKKEITSSVKVYLEDLTTKEVQEINNNDSVSVYLKKRNDGHKPSFNLVFVNNSDQGMFELIKKDVFTSYAPVSY